MAITSDCKVNLLRNATKFIAIHEMTSSGRNKGDV